MLKNDFIHTYPRLLVYIQWSFNPLGVNGTLESKDALTSICRFKELFNSYSLFQRACGVLEDYSHSIVILFCSCQGNLVDGTK